MLLVFEIVRRAKNHGKKFPNLSQISFSGIVHCIWNIQIGMYDA